MRKFKAKNENEASVYSDACEMAKIMSSRWYGYCERSYLWVHEDCGGDDPAVLPITPSEVVVVLPATRKYHKLVKWNVRDDKASSVAAFVDRETGDVYKPASWSAPAKHARGNVANAYGVDAIDASGFVKYL